MPELPEVETTCRGIASVILGKSIKVIHVRDGRLRDPVPDSITEVAGREIETVWRRAKYILIDLSGGESLLIHLGMSGSLRICPTGTPFRKHDHVTLELDGSIELRYHDPRRFGRFISIPTSALKDHPLLAFLGPEPLGEDFNAAGLKASLRGRRTSIKAALMDSRVVVGIGNIYASEALFVAGVRPTTPAGRVSLQRCARIVDAAREVLQRSINVGGTTLRDFVNSEGSPGYFRQQLNVYDRAGELCRSCGELIRQRTLSQRSTYWCNKCQK